MMIKTLYSSKKNKLLDNGLEFWYSVTENFSKKIEMKWKQKILFFFKQTAML